MDFKLGLDIGSISVNTIVTDNKNIIIEEYYDYCHGRPFHILFNRLNTILENHNEDDGLLYCYGNYYPDTAATLQDETAILLTTPVGNDKMTAYPRDPGFKKPN